jgi:hypothetical protein
MVVDQADRSSVSQAGELVLKDGVVVLERSSAKFGDVGIQQRHARFGRAVRAVGAQSLQNGVVAAPNSGVQRFDTHEKSESHGHVAKRDGRSAWVVDCLDNCRAWLLHELQLHGMVLDFAIRFVCRGVERSTAKECERDESTVSWHSVASFSSFNLCEVSTAATHFATAKRGAA